MAGMAKETEFISASEAADLLGVSTRQVLNLIADKLLPASKLGKSHMIRHPLLYEAVLRDR